VVIVEALYIAATQDKEHAVAHYLEDHLTAGTLSLAALRCDFHPTSAPLPSVDLHQHSLADYDQLLHCTQLALPIPESLSQDPQTLPHASSMGGD